MWVKSIAAAIQADPVSSGATLAGQSTPPTFIMPRALGAGIVHRSVGGGAAIQVFPVAHGAAVTVHTVQPAACTMRRAPGVGVKMSPNFFGTTGSDIKVSLDKVFAQRITLSGDSIYSNNLCGGLALFFT